MFSVVLFVNHEVEGLSSGMDLDLLEIYSNNAQYDNVTISNMWKLLASTAIENIVRKLESQRLTQTFQLLFKFLICFLPAHLSIQRIIVRSIGTNREWFSDVCEISSSTSPTHSKERVLAVLPHSTFMLVDDLTCFPKTINILRRAGFMTMVSLYC